MFCLPENTRRVVVKVGTNSLTTREGSLVPGQLDSLALGISQMHKSGLEVILVSSGAIGLGMSEFHMTKRPVELSRLQACAAMGQGILTENWRRSLQKFNLPAAQILLTREDIRSRRRSIAVRNTLEDLLKLGAVPIVNENDTVSADEIKFGDNDVLSALSAILLDADFLIILSTIPGLLDRNADNRLIQRVAAITPEIEALAGGSDSPTATGGMKTKIEAARLCTGAGIGCFIGSGKKEGILEALIGPSTEGTVFDPGPSSLIARKRWIAYLAESRGKLVLDSGAVRAVMDQGSSLLARGIQKVHGVFPRKSVVDITDSDGLLLAKGITRFSSDDLELLEGKSNEEIRDRLPEIPRQEVVHRDDLAVLPIASTSGN